MKTLVFGIYFCAIFIWALLCGLHGLFKYGGLIEGILSAMDGGLNVATLGAWGHYRGAEKFDAISSTTQIRLETRTYPALGSIVFGLGLLAILLFLLLLGFGFIEIPTLSTLLSFAAIGAGTGLVDPKIKDLLPKRPPIPKKKKQKTAIIKKKRKPEAKTVAACNKWWTKNGGGIAAPTPQEVTAAEERGDQIYLDQAAVTTLARPEFFECIRCHIERLFTLKNFWSRSNYTHGLDSVCIPCRKLARDEAKKKRAAKTQAKKARLAKKKARDDREARK